MAKKYIDIKLTYGKLNPIPNSKEDLIFCYHSFDTLYDYKSEDLGNFYDVGYVKDDSVVWQSENTGEYRLGFDDKDEFIEKTECDAFGAFSLYINKYKKKDIKVIINNNGHFAIIYKDKYRFKF